MAEEDKKGNIGQGDGKKLTPEFQADWYRLWVENNMAGNPTLWIDMFGFSFSPMAWDSMGAKKAAKQLRDAADWIENHAAHHLMRPQKPR